MKAAYVCRACERKLRALPLAQTSRCFVRQTTRYLATKARFIDSRVGDEQDDFASRFAGVKRFEKPKPHQAKGYDGPRPSAAGEGSSLTKASSKEPSTFGKPPVTSDPRFIDRPDIAESEPTQASPPKRSSHQKSQTTRRRKIVKVTFPPDSPDLKASRSGGGVRKMIKKKQEIRQIQWAQIKAAHKDATKEDLSAIKRDFNKWKGFFESLDHPGASDHRDGKKRRPMALISRSSLWECDTVEDMRSAWQSKELGSRMNKWPILMLAAMASQPDRAHLVLLATLSPLPPAYAVQDACSFIVRRFDEKQQRGEMDPLLNQTKDEIIELMHKLSGMASESYLPFTQATIGLFVKSCPRFHVQMIYDTLKAAHIPLSHNTSIQFASRLAADSSFKSGPDDDDYKRTALKILLDAASKGLDLGLPKVTQAISKLLRCGPRTGRPNEFSPDLALHDLIEKGLAPNDDHTNSLMGTLCRRGQVDEALKLAKLFTQNSINLGPKTYHKLFAAVRDSERAEHLEDVLQMMKSAGMKEAMIVEKALSAIFSFCRNEFRRKKYTPVQEAQPFLHMLRVYEKKFPLVPLQHLIPENLPVLLIRDPAAVGAGSAVEWDYERTAVAVAMRTVWSLSQDAMHVSLDNIGLMYRAYILSLWHRPYDLLALYQHFKELLESGDELARHLVTRQQSRVHNSFLQAMLSHQGLVRPALQVFGDMLRDGLWEPNADGSASRRSPCHPAPTIYTYGVLLDGLSRRMETTMMNQIMDIMRENGVEPNLVTMNTQIKSQAMAQNTGAVVTLMQSLEVQGFEPDQFTLDAFGKLGDAQKKRALLMIQRIIDSRSQMLEREAAGREMSAS